MGSSSTTSTVVMLVFNRAGAETVASRSLRRA
jgi:hypothetical protein